MMNGYGIESLTQHVSFGDLSYFLYTAVSFELSLQIRFISMVILLTRQSKQLASTS